MKLITFLLLINFTNLQSHEAFDTDDKGLPFFSYSELKLNETTDLKSEKDLLISILIHSKWSDFNSIIKLSTADLRAILISELNIRTNENINILSSNTNIELSTFCLIYTFLKTAAVRTESKLQEMFLIDLRNTLIIENEKHLNKNINTLQALTTKKLVQLGYSWYLPKTYNNFINFNFSQRSTKPSRSKFKLKDDLRRRMNVIKIVKTNESCPQKCSPGGYHKMERRLPCRL